MYACDDLTVNLKLTLTENSRLSKVPTERNPRLPTKEYRVKFNCVLQTIVNWLGWQMSTELVKKYLQLGFTP